MSSDTLTLVNPFAALGAIAGPAILTNACSILALGTSNRLGRVVDRTRVIAQEMTTSSSHDPNQSLRNSALRNLDRRAHLLLNALRSFYAAIGLFGISALLSAIGSAIATYGREPADKVAAIAALIAGTAAVVTVLHGCIVMTGETRLAVRTVEEEIQLLAPKARYVSVRPVSDFSRCTMV